MDRVRVMICLLVGVMVFALFLGGCGSLYSKPGVASMVATKRTGPPSHAPAHGYRKKHSYWYYPNSSVYYDKGREMFFYVSDGRWAASSSLPSKIQLDTQDVVTMELRTERPYLDFKEHKKMYPPKK